MAEDVKVPAIGPVKREYLYAGLAVIAGVAGYAWWRTRAVGDTSGVVVDPATGSVGDGLSYNNPAPGTTGGGDDGTPSAPRTNQEWAAAARDRLMEAGYEPGYVALVLGKYLDRQGLTPDEAAVVRAAWAYVGHPPEGSYPIVPIGTTTPPPTPPPPAPPAPPPPAPPAARTWVVQSGQTLSGIASYLRAHAGYTGTWQQLYQRNSAVIEAAAKAHGKKSSNGGNLIFPGTTLTY